MGLWRRGTRPQALAAASCGHKSCWVSIRSGLRNPPLPGPPSHTSQVPALTWPRSRWAENDRAQAVKTPVLRGRQRRKQSKEAWFRAARDTRQPSSVPVPVGSSHREATGGQEDFTGLGAALTTQNLRYPHEPRAGTAASQESKPRTSVPARNGGRVSGCPCCPTGKAATRGQPLAETSISCICQPLAAPHMACSTELGTAALV